MSDARHRIADLLYTYVDIADRKDVDAVTALLGRTHIKFPAPAAEASNPDEVRALFTRLWAAPSGHRHDVTNLRATENADGSCSATAHYTRWVLESEPLLHTLGEYALVVDRDGNITELTVTRTWTRE